MDNLTPITREEMLMNDEPLTPITREEKILAGEDLTPVTRREYFLKKYRHAGGDVMVEELSVTANGTYTAPDGKAYSPVEVDVPMPDNAYLLKEASGSLVSFNDGADLPMPSFVCNIDAVQDLHGYDNPWVGGAGKNKLPLIINQLKTENTAGTWSGNTYTYNGIVYTVLTDNNNNITGINADGTATNISYFNIDFGGQIPVGDYYANGGADGGSYNTYDVYFYNTTSDARMTKWDGTTPSESIFNSSSSAEIRVPNTTDVLRYRIRIRSGIEVEDVVFYPMIRLATEQDSTFEPYSNICPISGHTGVDALVRGKNLANPATVTTLYPTGESGSYPNQIRNSSNARSVITEVTPNTTYIISKKAGQCFRLAFTAEEPANGVADYGYTWNDTGTTITTTSPSNAKYMVVLFWSANVDTDTEEDMLATVQIELGETVTTYEPYNPNSQTIQVNWQTEAGEVYGGEIDLVSGELTVDRVGVTYSDTDRKRDDGSFRLYPLPSNALVTNTDNEQPSPLFICDKYKFMSIAEVITTSAVNVGIGISKTSSGFYIKDTAMLQMTLEEAQIYLSSHPIDVVYPLATPITYQLTPTQIKSLLGNNNAWCDTGDVDIDYFAKEVTG